MKRQSLAQRLNIIEKDMALLITVGKITTPYYAQLDEKYEKVIASLSKPMLAINICACGKVTEQVVVEEPLDYKATRESIQFTLYEVQSTTCKHCQGQNTIGGNEE